MLLSRTAIFRRLEVLFLIYSFNLNSPFVRAHTRIDFPWLISFIALFCNNILHIIFPQYMTSTMVHLKDLNPYYSPSFLPFFLFPRMKLEPFFAKQHAAARAFLPRSFCFNLLALISKLALAIHCCNTLSNTCQI